MRLGRVVCAMNGFKGLFVDYNFVVRALVVADEIERIGNTIFCHWVYKEAEFLLIVTTPSLFDLLLS